MSPVCIEIQPRPKLTMLKKYLNLPVILVFTLVVANIATIGILVQSKAKAANFSMQTGSYMGTGGAGLAITGLGFQPSTVMIKSSTAAGVAVFKTSAMAANTTAFTSATADNTGTSIQLTATGFTVGTLVNVNTANVLYHWTAFTGSDCSATGNYCVGTYTGNGTSPRTITTGFQPSYVMAKRSTAVAAHFRVAAEPANETLFFTDTARDTAGNYIQSFSATGFTVGATDNASGGIYYYIAFKATAGIMNQGVYTGDVVDNRNITGVGFVPDSVMVKNATSITTANRRPVMNHTESYGDNSSYLGIATANLVNAVQTLQTDGFQIGTAVQVNESAATFYWVAFGGAAEYIANGDFTMQTGTYTGTTASLPVTGIGFAPDLVIIKDNTTNYAVFRTKVMAGDTTAYLSNAVANFTGGITTLDSNGFTVGTSTVTNTLGTTYQWQAFGNAFNTYSNSGASDFAIGAYYGNGIDNRTISRLPFQPNMVGMKRNSTSAGTWRSSSMAGDLSSFYGATAEAANYIQALNTDGFQVGTNAAVNTAAGLHYWFAFKTSANFAVGNYTGSGGTQNVTTVGFQPNAVMVKRSTAVNGVYRGSSLAGDATQYFANLANVTDRITSLNANGFSVGGAQTETNTSAGTYRYAAWRVPSAGVLSFDIVDSGGSSVSSPSYAMSDHTFSFSCTDKTGTLGTNTQRLRVTNTTTTPGWALSIAATNGTTSLWQNGGNTEQFDYNDNTGTPTGCGDGADGDSKSGQLTFNPTVGSNSPEAGCSAANIGLGSQASFVEGSVNSVTLASATSSAQTDCYWDLTNISSSQAIPSEQATSTYTLNLTLTIIAQ